MKRFLILGAGVSALVLAWFLKRRFGDRIDLKIIDCDKETSKDIFTEKKHGFIFEQGYRSFGYEINTRETFKLLDELGLRNQVTYSSPKNASKYIFQKRGMKKIAGKSLWHAFSFLLHSKALDTDESIYNYFAASFGKRFATKIAAPFFRSYCLGDIQKLSLKSCFPHLQRRKNLFLNEIFSKKRIFSLKCGMETLIDELLLRVDPCIMHAKELSSLEFLPKSIKAVFSDGSKIEADRIFSTISAPVLAKLFSPIHHGLSRLFDSIPHQSLAIVNIGYHNLVMKKTFGSFFFPEEIEKNILSVFVDSNIFPEQNQIPEETRLTTLVNCEKIEKKSVVDYTVGKLSKYFGLDFLPYVTSVRFAEESYPQYLVGHDSKLKEIDNTLNRVFSRFSIFGKSFSAIDVNNQIAQCKEIEESVFL